MNKKPISRNAYFSAAVILFIYLLGLIAKGYLFQIFPAEESDPLSKVSRESIPPLLLASFLMLLLSFAVLYPILVICKYQYTTSPIMAVVVFVALFFSGLTAIVSQSIYLFSIVMRLPWMVLTVDGPHVREDAVRELNNFLNLRRNLHFPVTMIQVICSVTLAVKFSKQLKINALVRLAFGINAVYMLVHLVCLIMSFYDAADYNRTLHLPVELFIYGLLLVWFMRMPYWTKDSATLP